MEASKVFFKTVMTLMSLKSMWIILINFSSSWNRTQGSSFTNRIVTEAQVWQVQKGQMIHLAKRIAPKEGTQGLGVRLRPLAVDLVLSVNNSCILVAWPWIFL